MDLVVLAAVGIGADTLCERVPGIPVRGEVAVAELQVAGVDVLALARALVWTDGRALGAVVLLRVEVLRVDLSMPRA